MPRRPTTTRPTRPARRQAALAALAAVPGLAAGGGLLAGSLVLVRAIRPPGFRISDPEGPPTLDFAGRARSVQAAELTLRPETLDAIWSPAGLERLGRTYWRFLGRITLGLIGVIQTPDAELVVLLGRPAVLLAFGPPEYLLEADRGLITWPIRGGLLAVGRPDATPTATAAAGLLRLELRRLDSTAARRPAVRVEVTVVDFRPTIARCFGPTAYALTQAKVHVFVTHSFMRALARVRPASLASPPAPAESRTGRGPPRPPASRDHRSEISGNSI